MPRVHALHFTSATGVLAALLLVHAALIPVAVRRLSPGARTVVEQARRYASRTQSADSWQPMAAARGYALTHKQQSLYEEVFFRQHTKFQYPPTSLLLVGTLSRGALNALSWAAVWVVVLLSAWLFADATRRAGAAFLHPRGSLDGLARTVVVVALAMTFYPLVRAYTLGQIQVWVDALFAIAIAAWWTGRRFVAGLMVGVLCLIKPPFLLILVWGIVRRERALLTGAALVLLAGLAASIAAYGLASHLDYPRVLSFIGERGEAFHQNQSFNGLLNRLMGNGEAVTWNEHAFAPPHRGVYAGTHIAAAVLTLAALVVPGRAGAHVASGDFALIGLTSTIVSPVAWEHHYGILLPILAATVPLILCARPFGRATALALALAFLLTGQFLAPALLRFSGPLASLALSYVLAGALLIWIALVSAVRSVRIAERCWNAAAALRT